MRKAPKMRSLVRDEAGNGRERINIEAGKLSKP